MQEDLKGIIQNLKNEPGFVFMRLEQLIEKYALKPIGLTNINIKILMIIVVYGQVYQTDILKYLPTTPANISQRLDKMYKQNLIVRKNRITKDRRKNLIQLTKKGRKLFEKGLEKILKIKKLWREKFSAQELKAYYQFHNKLNKILPEIEEKIQTTIDIEK